MDLFTPIVEEDKLHNNFKNIILEPEAYARDVINEWADGFIDRDGKFIKEFQTTFNSSFWEIYLYASLKQFNYSIDFTFQAPDFVVNDEGSKTYIEATTANHAQGTDPEWGQRLEI